MIKGKKIAVAMSGGIDSSVSAYLLKKAGADVFGITMLTIPNSKCCSIQDVERARKVAEILDIPHYIVDFRKLFENEVIKYFIKESLLGRNPNPCVKCNIKVKFGALLMEAEKLGAEILATGHYARLEVGNKITLRRAIDIKKDQSYVLSMLPKDIFKKLMFPIGGYKKEEVKRIGEKIIKIFKKPNKDLCFLDVDKGEFIEKYKGGKEGNIVDKDGNILGRHNGYFYFTIGQRRGLGLKSKKRLYVVGINPERNEVIVGEKNELYRNEFYVEGLNWVSIDEPKKKISAEVIIRDKMKPVKADLIPNDDCIKVLVKKPVWAVSPGQIAVFVRKDVVLGGGWIK